MTPRICVNGAEQDFVPPSSVADLIARLGLDTRKVAIERNAAIVPRSAYGHTLLTAGDSIEIVHFIGGG